jgi:hypothetical protein
MAMAQDVRGNMLQEKNRMKQVTKSQNADRLKREEPGGPGSSARHQCGHGV